MCNTIVYQCLTYHTKQYISDLFGKKLNPANLQQQKKNIIYIFSDSFICQISKYSFLGRRDYRVIVLSYYKL